MDINIKGQNFEIKIPIFFKNTIIRGNSGTGKTFFVNILHSLISEEALRDSVKSNIDFDNTIVVRNKSDIMEIKETDSNKIIVLDRADTYLNKKLVDFINNSKNTFIIMTRCDGASGDIDSTINAHLELKSSKTNGFTKILGKSIA